MLKADENCDKLYIFEHVLCSLINLLVQLTKILSNKYIYYMLIGI